MSVLPSKSRLSRALLAFASATALTAAALAQPAPAPAPDDEETDEEVVVTGTRTPGRSRLDTIAPVDVVTGKALSRVGIATELAAGLAAQAPSISFPRPAITDGSDHVRPATLRGLAPDQTLVLINGIRGHVGALVNVNGNIGRGSTAFDLNTVPAVALGSVEVLRDGAAAQYGADAIAGVINLRLRQADSGGYLTFNYGYYDTEYSTARGKHTREDGDTMSVAGWAGLKLGEQGGFLTISAEMVVRDPTNRSDYVNGSALPLYLPNTVLGRFGDPELDSFTGWFNSAVPFNNGWEFYAFGGAQDRESTAAATARQYNNANNVLAVYPLGFLPKIRTDIKDYNLFAGVRGEAGGWDIDLSLGWGRNALRYQVVDSINASYGTASPRSFYAGSLAYEQLTVGLDVVRAFDVGLVEPLNVAFGLEYRDESFEVQAGEALSYTKGPLNAAGVSQGFPGFRPSNEVDASRDSFSAYIDFEGKLTEGLSFGLAGRFEDYSDFGDELTGKASLRYDFNESFAIRGAISSGFKAPALQQQFFSYTSTNLVTTVVGGVPISQLIEAGTFRVNDPAAISLGAKPLEPETSINYSAGAVLRLDNFELTIDAYQIEVENRIVYSENLGLVTPTQTAQTVAIVQALLAPYGVSAARFFLNGVDTTTKGIDIVARYRLETETAGLFDFTIAANFNETEVTRTPDLPTITAQPSPAFLFDRANVLSFEKGTPESKIMGSLDWSKDGWGATVRATYYDSVLVPNNSSTLDYSTGSDTLLDLELRYDFESGLGLAGGVNNVTDEYPNFTPATINSPTGSVGFSSYSPYGFNGRFIYGRISYSF